MSMTVPLFAIRDSEYRDVVETAALSVLRGGQYLMGPALKKFEGDLANYQNTKHAIGVANGTDALVIALLALGIKSGDRVALVANAGGYGSFACVQIGAIPVVVDIDPITHQIDTASFTTVVKNKKISAVIVTHLYGLMAPVTEIKAIADQHGIKVLEDVAQAMGAAKNGRKSGVFGHAATFSFYPTKNLGAAGDAGAVVTSDDAVADTVWALRQYGWRDKYHAEIPMGRNSRMDDLQAAILSAKLPYLDTWNAKRRAIWSRYKDSSMNMVGRNDETFTAHLCMAQVDDVNAWQKKMSAAGIATAVHYPVMDHQQEALKNIIEIPVPLPNTGASQGHIITLPCFPEMTDAEIDYVCEHLKS